MAVKIVSGVPGSGKTLYSVFLAKYHFKKENSKLVKFLRKLIIKIKNLFIFISNIFRRIRKKEVEPYKIDVYKKYIYDNQGKVNNIYSNFPILLYTYFDKESMKFKKVYSNDISLWDLKGSYSFLPYSLILIVMNILIKKLEKILDLLQSFYKHIDILELKILYLYHNIQIELWQRLEMLLMNV